MCIQWESATPLGQPNLEFASTWSFQKPGVNIIILDSHQYQYMHLHPCCFDLLFVDLVRDLLEMNTVKEPGMITGLT